MTIRLLLISHAATAAMRGGRFPASPGAESLLDAIDPGHPREQAALTALRQRLRAEDKAVAVCSPSACARDTATALGLDARIETALADMDYGRWQGRRLADFGADEALQLEQWCRDPYAAPHGGESFAAVLERVGRWLDGWSDPGNGGSRNGDLSFIAITHAPLIRAALLHALQAPPDSFARIEVAPLTVVELRAAASGKGRAAAPEWRWWPGTV